MARFFHHQIQDVWRRVCIPLLAFSFLSGILSGVSIFNGSFTASLMHSILNDSVSIVSLILFTFLPFLLSAVAVFLKKPGLILIFSFVKGVLLTFTALHVSLSFGETGWLARFLLLFSDLLSMPLLFFFWLRHISGGRAPAQEEVFLYFALVSLICSVDFCLISPISANLILF